MASSKLAIKGGSPVREKAFSIRSTMGKKRKKLLWLS